MTPLVRSSEMDRALACPASLLLTRRVKPREDSAESNEGTMLHWMIADRLIREHGAYPPEDGLPPPSVPNGYTLPKPSRWIVDWAIRQVLEIVPSHWSILVEPEMEHSFARWTNRGHADVIAFNPEGTESIGFDWKTGREPEDPADNNEQVLSYLCLKKLNWGSLQRGRFFIGQPRADEDGGFPRLSEVVLEGDALEQTPDILDARMQHSLDNPMLLNSGRKQCKYCPAKLSCPAIQAERDHMKMTMTQAQLDQIKHEPDDRLIADWVLSGRVLGAAIEEAEKLAKLRIATTGGITASDGTQIAVKVGRGKYEVTDPEAFWEVTKELLPEELRARCARWSMTDLKDAIAEHMQIPVSGKGPMTAQGVFEAKCGGLVEQGERSTFVFRQ